MYIRQLTNGGLHSNPTLCITFLIFILGFIKSFPIKARYNYLYHC